MLFAVGIERDDLLPLLHGIVSLNRVISWYTASVGSPSIVWPRRATAPVRDRA